MKDPRFKKDTDARGIRQTKDRIPGPHVMGPEIRSFSGICPLKRRSLYDGPVFSVSAACARPQPGPFYPGEEGILPSKYLRMASLALTVRTIRSQSREGEASSLSA